jgi:hypothetical protein
MQDARFSRMFEQKQFEIDEVGLSHGCWEAFVGVPAGALPVPVSEWA